MCDGFITIPKLLTESREADFRRKKVEHTVGERT